MGQGVRADGYGRGYVCMGAMYVRDAILLPTPGGLQGRVVYQCRSYITLDLGL